MGVYGRSVGNGDGEGEGEGDGDGEGVGRLADSAEPMMTDCTMRARCIAGAGMLANGFPQALVVRVRMDAFGQAVRSVRYVQSSKSP